MQAGECELSVLKLRSVNYLYYCDISGLKSRLSRIPCTIGSYENKSWAKIDYVTQFIKENKFARSAVDRFNNRRYDKQGLSGPKGEEGEYAPVDTCVNSVLGQDLELSDEFKVEYYFLIWRRKGGQGLEMILLSLNFRINKSFGLSVNEEATCIV